MAEIEVEAAAAVLGMRVGTRTRFEDTEFLRAVIAAGKLFIPCEQFAGEQVAAEQVSRGRHPAGRRRAELVELVEVDAEQLGAAAELPEVVEPAEVDEGA